MKHRGVRLERKYTYDVVSQKEDGSDAHTRKRLIGYGFPNSHRIVAESPLEIPKVIDSLIEKTMAVNGVDERAAVKLLNLS